MNKIPMPKKMQFDKEKISMATQIVYEQNTTLPKEGYRLQIDEEHIRLQYRDDEGKYYGEQTLQYLQEETLYCGVIEDAPSFSYRGVHMDVARHFLTIEVLKAFIDQIAPLNFNVVHLHLSDEQGWRLEVNSYPNLVQIGSKRPYSNFGKTMDSKVHEGYYTKDQLIDLVAYAKQYHIDILPEINVPGHCSSILAAYPCFGCREDSVEVKTRGGVYKEILCAGNEEVYQFLFTIIDTLCDIFPYPYIHIGGDEAQKDHWRTCLKCQKKMEEEGLKTIAQLQDYFLNRIADYAKTKGKETIIFSDGLRMHHTCTNSDIQYWVGDVEQTKHVLASGRSVIVSTHGKYYFDLGYGQTSLRDVYDYDPTTIFEPYQTGVKGVEGMLWSEFMPDYEKRLYQGFPRLLALSETAWNHTQKQPYDEFLKRCVNFIKQHKISCAPQSMWDMSKGKRIFDILHYYHTTMNRQDRKQFVATLKNERKEKKENEERLRNNTD